MLAPRALPPEFAEFNRREGAPFGYTQSPRALRLARRTGAGARLVGPYAWQPNNSIRSYEYPWVFSQIQAHGQGLVIADVGAGLAGMQFTLARHGYDVHAVDPGMQARGRGWEVSVEFHQHLSAAYRAPVTLHNTTLDAAGLGPDSVDVVLSVSTIEHFAPEDFEVFAAAARSVLRSTGIYVLTIDLFLDLAPFTDATQNEFGTNVNVAELLGQLDAELVVGNPAELYGFPEFDAKTVQTNLSRYLIGSAYPALSQCIVARPSGPR